MSTNTYTRSYGRLLAVALLATTAQRVPAADLDAEIKAVDAKVIAWRRDIHEHPELSNREERTAKLVADHLRGLGLPVETGIAHTGVVALLDTGRPGPTI